MKINHQLTAALRRMALAVSLAAVSGMASAGIIHVTVDTSNFGVATGYLEMQLGTGNGPLVTALVNNMQGFDPNAYIDPFGVTQVAGGYLFRNDTVSDLYHAVNFGGLLSFDLTFASAFNPLLQSQTHFIVAAYDEANARLGTPRDGALADFVWTPAIAAGLEGTISAGIADPAVSFIPEPADPLLLGAGLGLMALVLRRRAKGAASLAF